MGLFNFLSKSKEAATAENVDKRQPTAANIIERTVSRQLLRTKQDVKAWRAATQTAERKELNPDRTELTRIYQDVILDGHLSALFSTLIHQTLGSPYWLESDKGVKDEVSSDKIQTAWFRKIMTYALESKIWGHSLVQLGNLVEDGFDDVKLVRREYVIPDIHRVKKELHLATSEQNLIDYTAPRFKPWILEFGERNDFGLLHKATPYVLWKKNVIIAWAQFSEIFGMPLRVAKTDVRDPDKLANMKKMMDEMGAAAYGIFDNDDTIEFIETSNTDVYRVFENLIDKANEEMSKLVLGQTMTTEDGSSRSQAEVHERVANDFITAMKWFVMDEIQNTVIPILELHQIIPAGLRFAWDKSEQISLTKKLDFVIQLKQAGFNIPADWVKETFEIPVEEGAPPVPFSQISNKSRAMSVMGEIYNLYKGFTPGTGHVHEHGE